MPMLLQVRFKIFTWNLPKKNNANDSEREYWVVNESSHKHATAILLQSYPGIFLETASWPVSSFEECFQIKLKHKI